MMLFTNHSWLSRHTRGSHVIFVALTSYSWLSRHIRGSPLFTNHTTHLYSNTRATYSWLLFKSASLQYMHTYTHTKTHTHTHTQTHTLSSCSCSPPTIHVQAHKDTHAHVHTRVVRERDWRSWLYTYTHALQLTATHYNTLQHTACVTP